MERYKYKLGIIYCTWLDLKASITAVSTNIFIYNQFSKEVSYC